MSEEETTAATTAEPPLSPSFPTSRVKKIVKIDKDITRITSEALFLVTGAAEIFLHFLAEKSSAVAAEKKRKTIKVEHLRIAVKRHQPTREFLLDSLPFPADSQPSDRPPVDRTVKEKPPPPHTRRIDSFFKKPAIEKRNADDVIVERSEDRVEDVDGVIPEQFEDADDVVMEHVEEVNDVVHVDEE